MVFAFIFSHWITLYIKLHIIKTKVHYSKQSILPTKSRLNNILQHTSELTGKTVQSLPIAIGQTLTAVFIFHINLPWYQITYRLIQSRLLPTKSEIHRVLYASTPVWNDGEKNVVSFSICQRSINSRYSIFRFTGFIFCGCWYHHIVDMPHLFLFGSTCEHRVQTPESTSMFMRKYWCLTNWDVNYPTMFHCIGSVPSGLCRGVHCNAITLVIGN